MDNIFERTQMLLGADKVNALHKKRVAVFGIGGVGGYAVEALARSGVGGIDLIDNDTISETNINRQIIALKSTVGMYKAEVSKNRVLDINPDIKAEAHCVFFTKENCHQFDFSKYDYIVDAIDTVTSKLLLAEMAREHNVPIISSMGTGNKLDPTKLEVTDIFKTSVCPLARVMRRELSKRGIKKLKVVYSKEEPLTPLFKAKDGERRSTPASIAFVPSVAGLIMASEVIKDLIKEDC